MKSIRPWLISSPDIPRVGAGKVRWATVAEPMSGVKEGIERKQHDYDLFVTCVAHAQELKAIIEGKEQLKSERRRRTYH